MASSVFHSKIELIRCNQCSSVQCTAARHTNVNDWQFIQTLSAWQYDCMYIHVLLLIASCLHGRNSANTHTWIEMVWRVGLDFHHRKTNQGKENFGLALSVYLWDNLNKAQTWCVKSISCSLSQSIFLFPSLLSAWLLIESQRCISERW